MKFDVRYEGVFIVVNDYLGVLPRNVTSSLPLLTSASCYGNHETHQRQCPQHLQLLGEAGTRTCPAGGGEVEGEL
jgi:hypothetical protein